MLLIGQGALASRRTPNCESIHSGREVQGRGEDAILGRKGGRGTGWHRVGIAEIGVSGRRAGQSTARGSVHTCDSVRAGESHGEVNQGDCDHVRSEPSRRRKREQ